MNKQIFKSANLQMKGQSMFELVIAIGVSALIIVILVSLVSSALQNAAFAKNETLAGKYAENATEWLRGQRDKSTDVFLTEINKSLGTQKCFNSLDWTSTGPCTEGVVVDANSDATPFTREIKFISLSNDPAKIIIEADATVYWTDSKGKHTVTSATDFSDWRQR